MGDQTDQRMTLALAAIADAYGKTGHEYDVTLFVDHHLAELSVEEWLEITGSESPTPREILSSLILIADDDEDLDVLDLTLPGEVTNYLLAVTFSENGQVEVISMES